MRQPSGREGEVGSYELDLLAVATAALAFLAVAAGLRAVAGAIAPWLGAAVAVIGTTVTAVAAYRKYPIYDEVGEQPRMIVMAGASPARTGCRTRHPRAGAPASPAARSRLEPAAMVVGLITGVIAIIKELVDLLGSAAG